MNVLSAFGRNRESLSGIHERLAHAFGTDYPDLEDRVSRKRDFCFRYFKAKILVGIITYGRKSDTES